MHIEHLHGNAIGAHIDALAALRIAVFREFPYLYDGSPDYEARYLQTYVDSPRSLCVLVRDSGGRVIGASTGLPLSDEDTAFRRPFKQAGMDVARVFYCGESIVLPEHRGRGLGTVFFDAREAHARTLGGFEWIAFCAVERPADHPLRPAHYRPLDAFWRRRGYRHHPELRTEYLWRDLGDTSDTAKPMSFWLKPLTNER